MHDLKYSEKLLEMVANKLGYAIILLQFGFGHYVAKFGWRGIVGMSYVYANGQRVWIEYDGGRDGRHFACVYAELVKTLYRTLERNGTISDGEKAVDADDVPEFMMGCVLNGYA